MSEGSRAMSIAAAMNRSAGAIWSRIIRPDASNLPTAAAEALLRLRIDDDDLARMHDLASRNQDGLLTEEESAELEAYRRVGLQLDLLHSKARDSLRRQTESPHQ